MNLLQRAFNYLWPVEPPDSPYRGKVGAAFFHPDMPWLNRLAKVHDATDDLIRLKQTTMTYQENDQRFIKALWIWEDHYHFTDETELLEAQLVDAEIMPVFRAYRWLRDEKSGDMDSLSYDDMNKFRAAYEKEKNYLDSWNKAQAEVNKA